MLDSGRISPRQLVFLLTLFVISTELIFLPGFIVKEAGEGAWLSIITAALFGAAVVLVVSALGQSYPGKSIIDYSEIIAGKAAGRAAGFLLVTYTFITGSIVLREFIELVEGAFMPETPPSVFAITFILTAALAVRAGIEVIARTGELFFMLTFLITVFLLVLLVKDLDLAKLLPIFGEGVNSIIRGALPTAGFMGELVLLAFLIPNLNRPKQAASAGLWSLILITITLIIITGSSIAVFGSKLTANTIFPSLALGRFISIGRFLEHLDAFFLIYWITTVFAKLSLFYYAAVIGTAQLTGLKDYRPLVLPAGVIFAVLSFVFFEDTIEMLEWIAKTWGPYSFTIEFLIPFFLLALALIKGKKERRVN